MAIDKDVEEVLDNVLMMVWADVLQYLRPLIPSSLLQRITEVHLNEINSEVERAVVEAEEAYDDGYNEGLDEGKSEGYDDGYAVGYAAGAESVETYEEL